MKKQDWLFVAYCVVFALFSVPLMLVKIPSMAWWVVWVVWGLYGCANVAIDLWYFRISRIYTVAFAISWILMWLAFGMGRQGWTVLGLSADAVDWVSIVVPVLAFIPWLMAGTRRNDAGTGTHPSRSGFVGR